VIEMRHHIVNHLRFNIASLLVIVVILAFGFAALSESNDFWDSGIFSITGLAPGRSTADYERQSKCCAGLIGSVVLKRLNKVNERTSWCAGVRWGERR
jgi:hypothetical protein